MVLFIFKSFLSLDDSPLFVLHELDEGPVAMEGGNIGRKLPVVGGIGDDINIRVKILSPHFLVELVKIFIVGNNFVVVPFGELLKENGQ